MKQTRSLSDPNIPDFTLYFDSVCSFIGNSICLKWVKILICFRIWLPSYEEVMELVHQNISPILSLMYVFIYQFGLDVTKPVFGGSDKARLNLVSSATETS